MIKAGEIPTGPFTKSNLTTDADPKTQTCVFDKPEWTLVQNTPTAPTSWALRYNGTLHTMAQQNRPIFIKLDLGADVQVPLTTEYVQYPTSITTQAEADACSGNGLTPPPVNLHTYNDDTTGKAAFPYAACKLSTSAEDESSLNYQRSYTYSEPLAQPIYVQGFGRIDGSTVIADYTGKSGIPAGRACKGGSANVGSIHPCILPTVDTGIEFVNYAQWRIDTSMLGLSSDYKVPSDKTTPNDNADPTPGYKGSDPAISVTGITVSNSPKRNRSVVQLNVAQFGVQGAGDPSVPIPSTTTPNNRDLNDQPAIMNDFKQVGVWQDASDGPDIGSDGSVMQNMYLNVNDDSVKIEAQNQYYHNATLLQGGVGGIMLGMYGVTRDGVDNSVVDGVYVPRIMELPASGWSAYSATHGLVSTRTCPRYFQNNAGAASQGTPSIANATIQNVKVFALNDDSAATVGQEPNSLDALVSVGVAAGSIYCGTTFDTGALAPSYTFGPIHLYNLNSGVQPQKPFVLYNSTGSTNVAWSGIDLGQAQVSTTINGDSDTYFSIATTKAQGTSNSLYVCGLNPTGKCLQQGTGITAVTTNADNISVLPATTSIANLASILTYPGK